MRQLLSRLDRIADTRSATVLLTGESGVGKDAAARYIHTHSPRASQPFVNVTCTALPEALLESELFGHERGAFTDARQRKLGLFEIADGGTIFLDEIGEMAPVLQAKLLRVLEERRFRRVGGAVDIRPDVRVVAATNRDLRTEIRARQFREDLYYRLAVLHVHIPPLRERNADVVLLARHFASKFVADCGRPGQALSTRAERRLLEHTWPGHVRELRNTIDRAVVLSNGTMIEPGDLDFEASAGGDEAEGDRLLHLPGRGLKLNLLERDLVIQALDRTRGNKTRAAVLLGLTRDQLASPTSALCIQTTPRDRAP